MAARSCSKNTTGLRMRCHASIQPRNHTCRPAHISSIFVAERAYHHCFFARHSPEKQSAKADETGRSGDPVRQQQSLTERHQPEPGIHRMSHQGVDAACDKDVAFAQVETDGPIMAEVTMASVKQP